MLPHSYTVDSLSKSHDLASAIVASSSPPQIISTCASIESFLHSHSTDLSRHFFSVAFPTLICKLFGFDDSTASLNSGWIQTILKSNDEVLANRVFSLLSPTGTLMNSISSVDRLSLVKYVFPKERLPEWTRFMLSKDKDCRVLSDLCPLFVGKIKEDSVKGSAYQVQLNVFEYYMFWFAYYPVCRGTCENPEQVSSKKNVGSKIEKWAFPIWGFANAKRASDQNIVCDLYVRLLYGYLRAYVPLHDLGSHQPYRSSLLHYSSGYDGSVMIRAEFLVHTLIHFWLVDNDFSPLSLNHCKSFGLSFPFRSVLGEMPPTPGLADLVKLFVKYLNLSSVTFLEESLKVDYSGTNPKWKASGSPHAAKSGDVTSTATSLQSIGTWNPLIQRPLYRFLLRTFLFCPVGTSIKNATMVFSVWTSYLEPWTISFEDFSELDAITDEPASTEKKKESVSRFQGYTPAWQNYVLANYLYYSSLVMHFIGFAHKFLHSDAEIVVQMVLKVMDILTSSKELVDLLKNVNTVFHSKATNPGKSMLNHLYRYVPSIHAQLQDWEDGLCETDADGSFLHENWNRDLRLFSEMEDGGQQLLQLFILRAEAELQAISGDKLSNNLQYIDSLKQTMSCLFDGHSLKSFQASPEEREVSQSRDDIFKPRRGDRSMTNKMKYKGDWMKRPVSDDEIAWLAQFLVRLCEWLNKSLGLNSRDGDEVGPSCRYVEISGDLDNVCGTIDTLKSILCSVCSWFLSMGVVVVGLMRRYGLRLNLRWLASKKVVFLLAVYAVITVCKRLVGQFHRVER